MLRTGPYPNQPTRSDTMARLELTYDTVADAALALIQSRVVGALSTVDEQGTPHARWMAGVPVGNGLGRLISVTARGSRKLDHLMANPRVCWLFSDPHDDEVVTLTGTMQILEDPTLAEPAWRQLERAARQYAMNLLSESENLWFVGLETQVETIEYMHPSQGLTHPVIYPVRQTTD